MSWVNTKTEAIKEICKELKIAEHSNIDWLIGLLFFLHKYDYDVIIKIQELVKSKRIFQPEGLTYAWAKEIIEDYIKKR